jgi:hypothetical protein
MPTKLTVDQLAHSDAEILIGEPVFVGTLAAIAPEGAVSAPARGHQNDAPAFGRGRTRPPDAITASIRSRVSGAFNAARR